MSSLELCPATTSILLSAIPTSLSEMITGSPYIPPLRQPSCLPELHRLEGLEKRLAQKFGMASPHGIDSVAILEEARRRATLPWGRLRSSVLAFVRKANGSAASRDDVGELQKLNRMRRNLTLIGYKFAPVPQPPPILTIGAPHRVDASRFWAVLIGIDAYKGDSLRGCVSDASCMQEFLRDHLRVPEQRIQCLLGSEKPIPGNTLTPSRANVVNTLYSLIHNDEIQFGDNIIVYYAGHGSSYLCSDCTSSGDPASLLDYAPTDCDLLQNCAAEHDEASEPKCRSSACPIEALCPIDRDTLDSQERWIPDISDRELNALFTEISRVKGHKITFIADCCHASGMTRSLIPEARMRSMAPAHHSDIKDMLRAADERLGHLPYYRPVSSKDWKPDMSSHIILAACCHYQTAKETIVGMVYRGQFTRRLVAVLTSGSLKKEMTYIELTTYLNHSCTQTPVVAGDHKNDRIWYQDAAT
ncbi:hypothetical protein EV421DRAFT_1157826 [Armillaria borealis]|uniref:Peptidase C14 caspase domain-containing protein n=1 Tax=Armillaria borealis TaxID=47425 RepID=A0AA39MIA9_9AGAR|nr:hypothetical protein EV421DRAFT_1157826 [Armillaria borealis]